jgi:hypothetical protein
MAALCRDPAASAQNANRPEERGGGGVDNSDRVVGNLPALRGGAIGEGNEKREPREATTARKENTLNRTAASRPLRALIRHLCVAPLRTALLCG